MWTVNSNEWQHGKICKVPRCKWMSMGLEHFASANSTFTKKGQISPAPAAPNTHMLAAAVPIIELGVGVLNRPFLLVVTLIPHHPVPAPCTQNTQKDCHRLTLSLIYKKGGKWRVSTIPIYTTIRLGNGCLFPYLRSVSFTVTLSVPVTHDGEKNHCKKLMDFNIYIFIDIEQGGRNFIQWCKNTSK